MFKKSYLSLVIGAAIATPLQAAEAALEEIVVTATKRATSLQDTPLAISAFSQESLDKNHVTNVYDIQGMVPSLHILENGDHATPLLFIRGQGSTNQTESGDPAVAFYIDGVYAARSQGSTAMMYDLERAEVLRGPQGTLFGRNSTAGAVSLHTARPKDEFEAGAELTAGSYNRRGFQGMINLPVTDNWAVRLAGITDEQDGNIDFAPGSPVPTAAKYGARDMTSFRLSSLAHFGGNIDWFASYERFVNQGTGNLPVPDGDDREAVIDTLGRLDFRTDTYRTRLDWSFSDDLTLSYIGGYSEIDHSQLWDGDQGRGGFQTNETVWSNHEAVQHELQLSNADDNRWRWTLGYFYFEEENGIRFDMQHGSWGEANGPGTDRVQAIFLQPRRTLESSSFFAQTTFDVTDSLRLSGGVRRTSDEREDKGGRSIDCLEIVVGEFPTPAPQASEVEPGGCYIRQNNDMGDTWKKTTYMARAEWDFSDDIMLYLSYATGFKSGVLQDGQDTSVTDGLVDREGNNALLVEPEENDNLELGVKSKLFDGAMTLNATLFHMTYEDMQVTSTVIDEVTEESTLRNTNAGEATMDGLEVEMNWAVTDNGRLTLTYAYLDATFDEFFTGDSQWQSQGNTWNPCQRNDGAGGCVGNVIDLSGNRMPFAPENAFTLSYIHDFPLASGALISPRIRLTYNSDMSLQPENRGDRPAGFLSPTDPGESDMDQQAAYTKLDVSLVYRSADDKWSAEAFVNNATDEEIKTGVGALGNEQSYYLWAPPREAGVRIKYNFE